MIQLSTYFYHTPQILCKSIFSHTHTHTHTHKHTHTHTHIYIYIYIYIVAVYVLLYGFSDKVPKCLEKNLDGNYTRMLRTFMKKSWKQNTPTPQFSGYLPPILHTLLMKANEISQALLKRVNTISLTMFS